MADNSLSHLFEDTVQITTEDLTCRLDPGESEVQEPQGNILLGKLICKGKLRRKAIAGTLKKAWSSFKGWSWKEDDEGILHFTFASNEDAWNVLNRRPWIICGALLVIMPWPSWLAPSEVQFNKSPFWVRLSGIPPFYWSKNNLEELAAKVSTTYKLPRYIDFERGSFGMGTLRFKATVEIDKPLFSGFYMKRQYIKDLWIQYKYEKLPKFCLICGVISHEQKFCFKPPTVIKDVNGAFFPMFGSWMTYDDDARWPFSPLLPKWFEEWIIQKRLTVDNKFKQIWKMDNSMKAIESWEAREQRNQYPWKRRMVEQVVEDLPETEEERVSCFPVVSLPGIGEVCPFEDTVNLVVKKMTANLPNSVASVVNTDSDHSSGVPSALIQVVDSNAVPGSASDATILLSNSLQAQLIPWPSKHLWEMGFQTLTGLGTVDKYMREPSLFNPLMEISDFRSMDYENGPKKRKALDGIIIGLGPSKCNELDTKAEEAINMYENHNQSTQFIEGKITSPIVIADGSSFSPGSVEEATIKRKRARPVTRKNEKATIESLEPIQAQRRRGRPSKANTNVRAKPTSFKRSHKNRATKQKQSLKAHWDNKLFDLIVDLDNHFVLVDRSYQEKPTCTIQEINLETQATTVRQLKELIQKSNPEVLFLSEARLPQEKFNCLMRKLHYPGICYVPPLGTVGGLALCWRLGVDCSIQSVDKNMIMGIIASDPIDHPWMIIGTYGPPAYGEKEAFWKNVGDFIDQCSLPIILMGDLNGTLRDKECLNYANSSSLTRYSFDLRRMVHRTGLIDLGYLGVKYTWFKKSVDPLGGSSLKRARLDHALASTDRRIAWSNAVLSHLTASSSDHNPILLDTLRGKHCTKPLFKYEMMWERDQRLFWVVKRAWLETSHDHPMVNLYRKIKHTKAHLTKWNKTHFRLLSTQINEARLALSSIEEAQIVDEKAHSEAREKLVEGLRREEIFWRQKSMEDLMEVPNEEEIVRTLSTMGIDRAPGPDGIPVAFFRTHWDTIKEDFIKFIKHFFHTAELPHYINDTNIVLVLKKECPSKVNDFRPIALCNVMYKCISKIITTRLRDVLPSIISPTQTPFIKGRCITENTAIAKEIIHSMSRRKGSRGFMMIKLDMENAYDKMDWEFLMEALSFHGIKNPLLGWIKSCIQIKKMNLLINGVKQGTITPSSGLRQGDPLSPTLFILAVDLLSRLLQDYTHKGKIRGMKVTRTAPSITHLMFVDDVILFGQATIKEAQAFMDCLHLYCSWSGQAINLQKSIVHFSKGVPRTRANEITSLLDHMPQPLMDATQGANLVSHFINENLTWNEDRVRQWFHERDARNILNIGLPLQLQPDSWRWLGEPRGTFSVKSAYKLVMNQSSQAQPNWDWKSLWNSPIHGRLKMLWWQLMRDALPTRGNLGMVISLQTRESPICGEGEETTLHLFWECYFAKAVWFGSLWGIRTDHLHCLNCPLREIINSVNRLHKDHLSKWRIRTEVRENTRIPEAGWWNCCTDVSIQSNQAYGVAVFRDHMDRIEAIYSERISATNPTLVEATMLALAAEFARANHMEKVTFYCDNEVAISNCSANCTTNRDIDISGVADRFKQAAQSLQDCKLGKIDRKFNFMTHNSAKWAAMNGATGVLELGTMDVNIFSDFMEWSPD
uniref:Reverse transcriptase domain-containing protein n=1 Tax=Cannabis sativa TaxID=3483 RepID=A0A803QGH5_CANSA